MWRHCRFQTTFSFYCNNIWKFTGVANYIWIILNTELWPLVNPEIVYYQIIFRVQHLCPVPHKKKNHTDIPIQLSDGSSNKHCGCPVLQRMLNVYLCWKCSTHLCSFPQKFQAYHGAHCHIFHLKCRGGYWETSSLCTNPVQAHIAHPGRCVIKCLSCCYLQKDKLSIT